MLNSTKIVFANVQETSEETQVQYVFEGGKYALTHFRNSSGQLQYLLGSNWINTENVAIAGSGTCNSVEQITLKGCRGKNVFLVLIRGVTSMITRDIRKR